METEFEHRRCEVQGLEQRKTEGPGLAMDGTSGA